MADLTFGGAFEGYLELCIRAENDPARAEATLEKLGRRDDVPDHLRKRIAVWIESLRAMQDSPPKGDALARAQHWLDRAEALLEASILSDPQAASSEEAYALLEEFVTAGHTGSADEPVPSAWKQRLAELRAVLDAPASPGK